MNIDIDTFLVRENGRVTVLDEDSTPLISIAGRSSYRVVRAGTKFAAWIKGRQPFLNLVDTDETVQRVRRNSFEKRTGRRALGDTYAVSEIRDDARRMHQLQKRLDIAPRAGVLTQIDSIQDALDHEPAPDSEEFREAIESLQQKARTRVLQMDQEMDRVILLSRLPLGYGGFKQVRVGMSLSSERILALGEPRDPSQPSHKWHREVASETEVSKILRGKSEDKFLSIQAATTTSGRKKMLMELAEGGNLSNHLFRIPQDAPLLARWMTELLDIGITLSEAKQVHRDMKPENILVKDGHLVLTDFGLSVPHGTKEYMRCGTIAYKAPEAYDTCTFTHKVDAYGIGLTLLEMAAGRPICVSNAVFQDRKILEVAYFRERALSLYPDNPIIGAVCQMLHPDPKHRWSARKAKKALGHLLEDPEALQTWARAIRIR